MAKQTKLTKRQITLIDDLLTGECDEQTVLDKHNVKPSLYYAWLADERFVEQLEQRIAAVRRQSELTLARYAPLAAAKLVALTNSENQETARKACLDIISLCDQPGKSHRRSAQTEIADPPSAIHLSDETAAKLLALLAEETAADSAAVS